MFTANEKIVPVAIEDEMRNSYIDYAMSVIVGRALPDVKDGLKPVHRRILHAMNEMGLSANKPYKKSARIVGEVLGKFHPHGDTAVYDTLVRMVQDFSLRYPLVDGQGNFGSIDGDSAAAMRYTEARLAKISDRLLDDIDKETVEFVPNFDESLLEPTVLPTRLPNLLINGSTGIAVGMATNIPPHNLGEVVEALVALIEEPDITIKKLRQKIKGPDFPTGGLICGREGIIAAYETGRGRIIMRGRAAIEQRKNGKEAIIITEIPYQVNKTNLINGIVKLVEDKTVEGISDIRDESDREGMRIVVELKRDANAQVILNHLHKHTQLQDSFGVIMLALVDGQPKVMNLKEMLWHFIMHRVDVVTRRTRFELAKAEKRAHILEGLKIAFENLDKIIKTIRASKTVEEAKTALMKGFKLSEPQAKAILEMQLQKLAALEIKKIEDEYLALLKTMEYLQSLLDSKKKMMGVIKDEFTELKDKYNDNRRTEIVASEDDIEIEDLIREEDVIITISHRGYIKRIPVSMYKSQRRGGRGVTGGGIKEEDFIEDIFLASTHDYLLFFSNKGKVYWRKTYDIPQASRQARGKAIVNFLSLGAEEKITNLICVREFDEKQSLVMVTEQGQFKKTNIMAYSRPRSNGIAAITLRDKDELVACNICETTDEVLIATAHGKAIRFKSDDVREMGRTASGVRGIRLGKNDKVIDSIILQKESLILTVTEQGYGKQTTSKEYRLQNRGGSGVINLKITSKNGKVIGVKAVKDDDEIILITTGGMIIRSSVNEIRTCGRNTQGVRLVKLKDKDLVAAVARVVAKDEEDDTPELPLETKG
ncbi:MAG: DNA gyrase subunit A [Candidatus Omnitrophica bacterium]|nr:DNA gyrase subunit A [Candidatus Omnitrophota bacterium]